MPNLTSVTLTAGVPTAGTGTVGTIDNVTGTAGSPSVPVLTVQGVASGTAQPVSGTVAATQSGTWTVQPGNTANTTPWLAKVGDGTNSAAIKAASTAPAATDPALVVAIHPLSVNANGQAAMAASAPVAIASDQTTLTTQLAATANIVSGVISSAMTGTTTTSLVSAPGANLRNYITTLIISNSHATVGTDILIQDGSGGTTLAVVPAAANFGGATVYFNPPLKQPTTNTALFAQNVTTGSNTKVSAFGYKAA